jgi:hypothetical protein
VGASHNIFVAKVIGQVGTKELGIGPETQFNVEIIDNIKGELKGIVMVDQLGGYENRVLYVVGDINNASFKNKKNSYFLQPGSTYLFATRYNSKQNWYTLNSYPTASKVLDTGANLSNSQLKSLAESDSRVKALKIAYPHEILLDADIKNNNILNNYKSMQERPIGQGKNNL